MKSFVMGAALSLSVVAASAHAQTAIQPGQWEVSDKTTMEGVQPMPSTSRQVYIKGGEATLERLLYPAHGQEQGWHDRQRQLRAEREEGGGLPLAPRTP